MGLWAWLALGVAVAAATAAHGEERARPSIELTRLQTTLRGGDRVGERQTGPDCAPAGALAWDAADAAAFALDAYRKLLRKALSDVGFAVPEPADDAAGAADVQVIAQIAGVRTTSCQKTALGPPADRTVMSVKWQVSAAAGGKVLARIETESSGSSSKGAQRALRGAFSANARQLARSEDFAKAVGGIPGPALPPPRAPRTAMILPLPASGKPMALGEAAKAVVSIFVGASMGSGVLISSDGHVLTNHHVAAEGARVRVRWPDGSETAGEVVRSDAHRDVALIRTAPPKVRALSIRHGPVELGETVYAIGTPLERDFAGTLTRGVVSTASRMFQGQSFIQSDVAVDHGNSGGPLLDEHGLLIGLTDLSYVPDGRSHNIGFFIPIDEALQALMLKPVR
ncbi:trypsin-like peptidase domain-containing protein [Phenylobacterium sp.]|uniref:S1C family serine protease n=1 Tax=Phenylobacterium sp. TaxID=1871053 RepID=UPI00286BC96C|nr:trypsin-like peptidase domain-containing protein [Phenylobacterium sp.]